MELLIGIAVIIIVVVAIKLGKQDKSSTAPVQPSQDKPQRGWQYMYLIGEVKRQAEERGDTETLQQALDLTYNGTMPHTKPDNTFTSIYNHVWDFNIAGINFRKGIKKYVGPFFGYLQPEPTNEYDPDAIAIYHSDGHHLGYIPQNMTDDIRDCGLPFPIQIWGDIEEDYDYDEKRRFFRGTVWMEIPDPNATHPYNPKVEI